MVCRLCETEQRLIKAHIIPEGFFRVLRDGSGALEVHTNKRGAHPRRAPIGVYDRSILCRPCDNVFSPWDKHAQDVMLRDFSDETAIYHGPMKLGWTISKFDYRQLKLFFLSLLWRASVSTHDFYRRVSTGPFEQSLRKMIAAGEPGPPETFAVTLARFREPAYTAMLDPHADRYHGVNYFRFYLAGFVAYIKVDGRPPQGPLAHFTLRDDAPITVLLRSARDSKDAAVMRDIAVLRGGGSMAVNAAVELTVGYVYARRISPRALNRDDSSRMARPSSLAHCTEAA